MRARVPAAKGAWPAELHPSYYIDAHHAPAHISPAPPQPSCPDAPPFLLHRQPRCRPDRVAPGRSGHGCLAPGRRGGRQRAPCQHRGGTGQGTRGGRRRPLRRHRGLPAATAPSARSRRASLARTCRWASSRAAPPTSSPMRSACRRHPKRICRTLMQGGEADIVCARVNGEPFLLMAGAGFDGRVISALDQRFKSYVGKAAYAGPVLGALVRPDGRPHRDGGRPRRTRRAGPSITNARHYGGRFVLTPRTGVQERGLQAVLFKARSRAVLIGQLMSLASGTLDARCANHGDVEMLTCAHVHDHIAPPRADPGRRRRVRLHAAPDRPGRCALEAHRAGRPRARPVNLSLTESANPHTECQPGAGDGGTSQTQGSSPRAEPRLTTQGVVGPANKRGRA